MSGGTLSIRRLLCSVVAALVAFAVTAGPSPVRAAQITVEPLKSNPKRVFISIEGDITESDVESFKRIALAHDEAVVWLSSNGGAMYPAIEIGRIIRLKEYDTFVGSLAPCNSACGLIFVAGVHRYLSKSAAVGFHATYLDHDGTKQESGVGNAVIGSYFAQLNLSERAVVFATTAPPDRVNSLTAANASEVGISVDVIDDVSTKASEENDEYKKYGEVGGWTIGIDKSLGRGCFIYATYDGGIGFRIGTDARSASGGKYLMVLGADWKSIQEKKEYQIQIKFDSGPPRTMNGFGGTLAELRGIIVIFEDKNFLEEFSRSSSAEIIYKGRSIERLSIASSGAALSEMNKCQREQRTRAEDPFAN